MMNTIDQRLDPADRFSTLVEILQYRATQQPDQVVYTFLTDLTDQSTEESVLTHRELDQQARRIAALLRKHTEPGARVLLCYPPGLDFIAAFFGCLYAGAVAVPAYPPRPNRSNLTL